ncbi:MAG: biotin--[acetyl-CoA-carboxylase] ligase [Bacteroidota bacterium]
MNIFSIGNTILEFEELGSTNDYALELAKKSEKILENGLVVFTKNQTNGRGQRENNWLSEKNCNLTFSICLNQLSITVNESFYLSMAIAVALKNFLNELMIDAQIKWPNDILVKNKKIAGILIENSLKGNIVSQSIVGVGININQQDFENLNATSVFNETQNKLDLKPALQNLLKCIEKELIKVSLKKYDLIKRDYLQHLIGFEKTQTYKANNDIFEAKIIDIKSDGAIELELNDKNKKKFYFKEVALVMSGEL